PVCAPQAHPVMPLWVWFRHGHQGLEVRPDTVITWHQPARSRRSSLSRATSLSPGSAATGPAPEPQLVLLGRPPVLRIDHAAPGSLRAPPCCCATSAIRQPRSWPPTSGARRAGSQRGIPARTWSWWPGSPPWLGAHFYLCSWCAELDLRHTEHPG